MKKGLLSDVCVKVARICSFSNLTGGKLGQIDQVVVALLFKSTNR